MAGKESRVIEINKLTLMIDNVIGSNLMFYATKELVKVALRKVVGE